ncbi:MAG: sn-glycerol-3-phosphate ABC transporter ATP-binding protein UgpC [Alphaproteobacteria bacterium]
MAELSLSDIEKAFGAVRVIHGVSLDVHDGEFVVLVGPSGCGKSTLLRIIAGLEGASAGDIVIDGQRVNAVPASDRGLAMVFQSYALYPHMTVYKNISFGLENTRMPRAEIDQRVRAAAEMLRITDYLDRRPKALSGGQRQRVAIGRAIVRDPKIFLFDEPLSNLDAELRVIMRKELAALHAKLGGTMIYVTHDQVEAMTLADRIVVLKDGRIEQVGTPLELYNRPRNQFVAGFIGSPKMNFLAARVAEDGAASAGLALDGGAVLKLPYAVPARVGDPVAVGVRPEHFEVLPAFAGEGRADISVHVDLDEQLGGETYFYCTAATGAQLTVHQPGQRPLTGGERLHLAIPPAAVHVFDATGAMIANGRDAIGKRA